MKSQQTIMSQLSRVLRLTTTGFALVLLSGANVARAHDDQDDQDELIIPAALQVPAGNTLSFHAEGVGVQIYAWNATTATWVFQAPSAVLFRHEGRVTGIHYAGPTWQSNDGSKVVGRKLAGVTVNTNAVPWLLLQATSTRGP